MSTFDIPWVEKKYVLCEFILFYLLVMFRFIYFYLMCMCVLVPCVCSVLGGQKRAWYPLELEFQSVVSWPCGCQEPNLVPGEEQQVHLAAEPSLQCALKNNF